MTTRTRPVLAHFPRSSKAPSSRTTSSAKAELRRLAAWADTLTEEEAARALKGIAERRAGCGTYVCHRGDRLDCWTGVVSGWLKVSTVSSAGKAITFANVGPGSWIGEGAILKNETRKYDLVALTNLKLAMMNRQTFMWLFENSLGFAQFVAHQLNERLGQFLATVESDRLHDPTRRTARAIAWLFNPTLSPKTGTHIDISQEEIALLAGLSRQLISHCLLDLKAAGLVSVQRGAIAVIDPDRLAQYRDDEPPDVVGTL
jgi:CRP/FNR family cyclic AMP-dependent transcriptional regulator